MENTNRLQPSPKREYQLHHYDPSRPLKEQRIVWDEEAKKRFRELPYNSGLDIEIDAVQLVLEIRGEV